MEDAKIITEVRDLTREVAVPQTGEKIHYLVAPAGSVVHSLAAMQYPAGVPPERITANLKFQDAASFNSYVNSFKDHRTRLFADATPGILTFLAAIDYHGAGDGMTAEFVSRRASFKMSHSEEWKIWSSLDGKLVPQTDFAEFIEDNRSDIIDPVSAVMLEIARDLQAHSEVNFASKINLRNGAAVLSYDEQIKASVTTGQIEVPETFKISIPVFFGERPVEISARLRFRITDGKLKFQYKLYRPAEIIAQAFDFARRDIEKATTLEVLLGTL